MADVFVSYASADRERVAVLVKALEQEDFTVWWDRRIEGGTVWDEDIERELNAARTVLVIWTETSRSRRWVREEAHVADRQGKLIPLEFDADCVPFGFGMIQAENFGGWDGDRQANCWKRLVDMLDARSGRTALKGEADAAEPSGPRWGAATSVSAVLSLATAGLLLVPSLFGTPLAVFPGFLPLSASVATALFFLILFMQAERRLKPQTKILVSRWLLPMEGKARVGVAEAFNDMFEAVFDRRHLSWRCLRRSAIASTVAFAVILIILEISTGYFLLDLNTWRDSFKYYDILFIGLLYVVVGAPVLNLIGDYFSLWETRLILRAMRRSPELLVGFVIMDLVLTTFIFSFFLFLSAFMYEFIYGFLDRQFDVNIMKVVNNSSELFEFYISEMIDLLSGRTQLGGGVLLASFLTTFITSVWLWMVLVLTPLSRMLVWTRSQVTALGKLLGAQQQPVATLGIAVAGLIVSVGLVLATGSAVAG